MSRATNDVFATATGFRRLWLTRILPWGFIVPGWIIATAIVVMFALLSLFLTSSFTNRKAVEWIIRSVVTLAVTTLIFEPLIAQVRNSFAIFNSIANAISAAI